MSPEAIIVAGGFGTRLRPLTDRRPKHLLEVGGVPFLEHQIARLAQAGVSRVAVATSYRAELFEPVLGDGSRWGLALDYVHEQEPLGTAGAIRNAAATLTSGPDDAVVVLNGDILSAHRLDQQLEDFAAPRDGRVVDVSLHLVEVEDARAFGCVPTDDSGRVLGFHEKSADPVSRQVNAGCYVFRRRVIDTVPGGQVVSVERETFPELVATGALVVGYLENAYWRDVGTPESLVAASQDLVLGRATSPAVDPEPTGARIARDTRVAATATVNSGSVVCDGCVVGAGAVVSGTVLMPRARVGDYAVLVDCAVGPGAVVGPATELQEVTVGDGVRVDAPVPPGTRLPVS